ncbi:hypothetical protein EXIGLDRAFT_721082 [Exidia glandulosa HHB12029]|uniref:PARP catalytic domain-containing protein n=1 Tax=Exidia glandulosa HHB12029 TaxID=1314781 RepID=A0A165FZX7_EXIGL|nr:hypothetical protein EXIGLDRAFT_721082 [Exidia glandulosa HHB12029]
MLGFTRLLLFAVLSLTVVTNAVPLDVVEQGASESTALAPNSTETLLPRKVAARPKPAPRKPVKPPPPVKTPIRRPTPTKRPTPVKTPIKRPVPARPPVKRPVPAKPPVKRPIPAKPPVRRPTPTRKPTRPPVKRPTPVPPRKPTPPPRKPTVPPKKPTPAPTKPTNGTKPLSVRISARCPVTPGRGKPGTPAKPPVKTKPRSILEYLTPRGLLSLFSSPVADDEEQDHEFAERNAVPEFIGFHGTNSATAAFWMSSGHIASQGGGGTSGADAELGNGLYVTDSWERAGMYGRGNAANMNVGKPANKKVRGMVCGIFARNRDRWREPGCSPKVWIPDQVVTSPRPSKSTRDAIISHVIGSSFPGMAAQYVVRFAAFDVRDHNQNQMVLPDAIVNMPELFFAQCVDAELLPDGTERPPPSIWPEAHGHNYRRMRPTTQWDIRG